MRRWESRHGGHKGILESLDIPGLKMSDLEAGLHKVAFEIHGGEFGKGDTGEINEGTLRQLLVPYLNQDWNKAGGMLAVPSLEKKLQETVSVIKMAPTMTEEAAMLGKLGVKDLAELEKMSPTSFYAAERTAVHQRKSMDPAV
jgi:hypothetical protein